MIGRAFTFSFLLHLVVVAGIFAIPPRLHAPEPEEIGFEVVTVSVPGSAESQGRGSPANSPEGLDETGLPAAPEPPLDPNPRELADLATPEPLEPLPPEDLVEPLPELYSDLPAEQVTPAAIESPVPEPLDVAAVEEAPLPPDVPQQTVSPSEIQTLPPEPLELAAASEAPLPAAVPPIEAEPPLSEPLLPEPAEVPLADLAPDIAAPPPPEPPSEPLQLAEVAPTSPDVAPSPDLASEPEIPDPEPPEQQVAALEEPREVPPEKPQRDVSLPEPARPQRAEPAQRTAEAASSQESAPQQAARPAASARESVVGAAEPSDLVKVIQAQVQPCWRSPPISGSSAPSVTIRVTLNRNGSISNASVLGRERMSNDSGFRAMARGAQAAFLRCGPYRLPGEHYARWRELEVEFHAN